MYYGTGDQVYVTDFPGHISTIQGSAACDIEGHADWYDHEMYLVYNPMGDEHWACQSDLEFFA